MDLNFGFERQRNEGESTERESFSQLPGTDSRSSDPSLWNQEQCIGVPPVVRTRWGWGCASGDSVMYLTVLAQALEEKGIARGVGSGSLLQIIACLNWNSGLELRIHLGLPQSIEAVCKTSLSSSSVAS